MFLLACVSSRFLLHAPVGFRFLATGEYSTTLEAAKAADAADVHSLRNSYGRALAEQRSENILSFHRAQSMNMAWDGLRYGIRPKITA